MTLPATPAADLAATEISPDSSLPREEATPAPAPVVAAVAPSGPVKFPITWLMEHAAGPIAYRSLTEVCRVPESVAERVSSLPLTHRPALLLALLQQPDGTWSSGMFGVPAPGAQNFEGVGTMAAVRRLMEYGWNKDTPPMMHARRVLFRLLAEDEDPTFLYELGADGMDEESVRRGRGLLREAAAAVLAQAGYEGDPRLRGAARRILVRIADYLRSPLAQKPFIRQGNHHMLAEEACPPSIHSLIMLAHMPLFRAEHHREMDALYAHVSQAHPRQEAVQAYGREPVPVPHLVLGDMLPHRNAADADVPFALFWLELMGRLGFLKRNENWFKLFERFLDDRGRDAVWHPHKGMVAAETANPYVWPVYPLEELAEGQERWADVTFRLGLIARIMGRPIEPV